MWVLKSGKKIYGKVLGLYLYYVEIDLFIGEGFCICLKGGNCEYVEVVRRVYENGVYFLENFKLVEVNFEVVVWEFLIEVLIFVVEVLVKELILVLKCDESGSEMVRFFFRIMKFIEFFGWEEYFYVLEEVFEEFVWVFFDYFLIEKIEKEFEVLKGRIRKVL